MGFWDAVKKIFIVLLILFVLFWAVVFFFAYKAGSGIGSGIKTAFGLQRDIVNRVADSVDHGTTAFAPYASDIVSAAIDA